MKKIIIDCRLLLKKINQNSGPLYKIVQKCLAGEYQPIISHNILKECVDYMGGSNIEPGYQNVLEDFFAISDIIKADFDLEEVKKDPDSNKYIQCALAGQADYLITENRHLLKLKRYLRTEIMAPGDFLKISKI